MQNKIPYFEAIYTLSCLRKDCARNLPRVSAFVSTSSFLRSNHSINDASLDSQTLSEKKLEKKRVKPLVRLFFDIFTAQGKSLFFDTSHINLYCSFLEKHCVLNAGPTEASSDLNASKFLIAIKSEGHAGIELSPKVIRYLPVHDFIYEIFEKVGSFS